MNRCFYKSVHGSFPKCDEKCSTCSYFYIDPLYTTIEEWKREAGVTNPVLWKFDRNRNKLCLYTTRPGYFIGYHGVLIEKYTNILKEKNCKIGDGIDLIECDDGIGV